MAISPRHFRMDSSPSQWTFLVRSQDDEEEVSSLLKSSSSESDSGNSSPLIPLSAPQIKDRLFLASSQEEVDFFQSPPLSPVCSSTQSSLTLTPEKVTQARELFKGIKNLDCEPMPRERKVIEEGMEALRLQSPDGPHKTRSRNTRDWFSNLLKRASSAVGPQSSIDLVSTHDKTVQMMECISLYRGVVTGLRQVDAKCEHPATHLPAPFEPVNYKHIVAPVVSDNPEKKTWDSTSAHLVISYFPSLLVLLSLPLAPLALGSRPIYHNRTNAPLFSPLILQLLKSSIR